jgi:gas vesicle protein
MTTSEKKMLAAGTIMGVVIGLVIALFIAIRPELFR